MSFFCNLSLSFVTFRDIIITKGSDSVFTEKLKNLRKAAGLTQVELAKKLGIAQSTLASYERGLREPDFEMLKQISSFFEISISDLLDIDIKNQPAPESELDRSLIEALTSLRESEVPAVLAFVEMLKAQRKE